METILGAPPPPPPPNVPPLEENDGTGTPTSLRDRMEQHRSNPVCASCHAQMDPLGFAMEHFDAIGRWREHDNGAAINANIEWDNKTIENPRQFREALAGQGTEFIRTVAEKLLTYAIGRGLTYHDGPIVRGLVRDLEQNNHKWSSLILGVVNSSPFRMRTTANETEASASTVAAR